MAAIGLATLLLLLDACTPQQGHDPMVEDIATKLQRWLWPPKPQPPVAPETKSTPPYVAPKNNAPAGISVDSAETAILAPAPKPKARPKASQKTSVDDGPDLPWPCWQVRLYATGRTEAELTAMEWRNGVMLSAKQRRQALACFDGFSKPIQ